MDELENVEDIISNLPDAIIHTILSLVPTKDVIRTSLLSKRWEKLSAENLVYANNLYFGEDFAQHQAPDQFLENLNRILSLSRSKKIDIFKLKFIPSTEFHFLEAASAIQFATDRQVNEIELDFCNQHLELPSSLFDCTSLVAATLRNCATILQIPETFAGFGNLQTLHLNHVNVSDSAIERLLANCQLLEALILKNCGSLSRIRILHPDRLKTLTIYECNNVSDLEIRSWKIRSFLLMGQRIREIRVVTMIMLENLFIGATGDDVGGALQIFNSLLPGFVGATRLTLYLGRLVPSVFAGLRMRFNKLQELQLVNSTRYGLFNSDVYCFFEHCACPSLASICIQLCFAPREEVWEYRHPDIEPIDYVFHNLKEVTLRNFSGSTADIELAKFFLQSSPMLKSMLLVTAPETDASSSTTSEGNTFEGTQEAVNAMLEHLTMASSGAQVRVTKHIAFDSLLSGLNRHHASDVYQNLVL